MNSIAVADQSVRAAEQQYGDGSREPWEALLLYQQLKVTMNRLDLTGGNVVWTQPDTVKIAVPAISAAQAAGR